MRASFAIDLFALGLMIAVLHRPLCHEASSVLPSEAVLPPLSHPLDDLSGASLRALLHCNGRSHEQVVTRLCSIDLAVRRMAAREALKALDKTKTDFIHQHDELKGAIGDKLDVIYEDSSAVKQSVLQLAGQVQETQREARAANYKAEDALDRAQDALAQQADISEMVFAATAAAVAISSKSEERTGARTEQTE